MSYILQLLAAEGSYWVLISLRTEYLYLNSQVPQCPVDIAHTGWFFTVPTQKLPVGKLWHLELLRWELLSSIWSPPKEAPTRKYSSIAAGILGFNKKLFWFLRSFLTNENAYSLSCAIASCALIGPHRNLVWFSKSPLCRRLHLLKFQVSYGANKERGCYSECYGFLFIQECNW